MRISDWSSDVCSSDLLLPAVDRGDDPVEARPGDPAAAARTAGRGHDRGASLCPALAPDPHSVMANIFGGLCRNCDRRPASAYRSRPFARRLPDLRIAAKIGRASCWERLCQSVYIKVVSVSFNK